MEREEDKQLWNTLNAWAMSDEESGEENHIRQFRTLPWRTDEATQLVRSCDAALGVVRVYGDPLEWQPDHRCENFVKPVQFEDTEEII